MAVFTEARYGFKWNYAPGDTGWGTDYNFTHRALGALLNAYLISDTDTAPPGSPADGVTYFVPAGATGAWAGQANKIASYQGGTWEFYAVPSGFRAYVVSRAGFYWWNGSTLIAELTSSGGGAVISVAARTGVVTLTHSDILDWGTTLSGYALITNPAFTGTPTAPTAASGTNTTQLATTAFVHTAVAAVSGAAVTSVAGRTGAVTLTHSDLTDWSSATSTFLTSAPVASVAGRTGTITLTHSDLTDWSSATSNFLTSAALTGYASTTYVDTAITNLINAAPSALNTLGEIATALAADESAASALTTTVAGKVSKSGDTMTGALHLVAPGGSDNSDIAVSSAWVQTYVASLGFGTGSGTITGVTAGTGLTGGGTSGAVTLNVAYGTASGTAAQGNDSRITGALQSASNLSDVGSAATTRTNLGLGTAAVAASTAFKAAGAVETWATLPAEAQNLPIPVAISGKPTASQTINVVMAMAITIPANFAGTVSYQGTQATASVAVTVNKISGGSTTAIGTITLGTSSKTAITLSTQAQVTFAAGDVLQFVWPTQDATLSDVGITLLAAKV